MTKRDRKFEERVVDCFLWAQRKMTDCVRDPSASPLDREIWAHLNEARLFVINPLLYGRIYRASDIFTTTTVCNLPWVPSEPPVFLDGEWHQTLTDADPVKGSGAIMLQVINEAGQEVPAPGKLPFDSIFLCYGPHLALTPSQRFIRHLDIKSTKQAILIGHLLYFTKDEFKAFEVHRSAEGELSTYAIYLEHNWLNPVDLSPWVVNTLVALVVKHQTFLIEQALTSGQRLALKRSTSNKLQAPIPKPYYIVVIRDQVIDETTEETNADLQRRTFEYSYRFDVQGHERCKIRRGTLPLDPKLAEKLDNLGYQVFTLADLPAEHLERLGRRQLPPKKPDEWLAIKVRWVSDYQKGPEGTPYVPAVRIPG